MPMICQGSRAVGMFSRMSFVNVLPVVVFFVSTTGVAAVTVSSSDIWPSSSFWSIWAVKPVVIDHVRAQRLLEAGELERHRERADGYAGELVGPAFRRHGDQRPLQRWTGHGHGDARHDSAGRISDFAEDLADRLRVGRSCRHGDHKRHEQDPSEDSRHLSSSLPTIHDESQTKGGTRHELLLGQGGPRRAAADLPQGGRILSPVSYIGQGRGQMRRFWDETPDYRMVYRPFPDTVL